jgi:hypothetical protein
MKKFALAAIAVALIGTPVIGAEVAPFGAIPTWSAPPVLATGIDTPQGTGIAPKTGFEVSGCTWKTNDGVALCDARSISGLNKDGLNPGTAYDGILSSGGAGAGN